MTAKKKPARKKPAPKPAPEPAPEIVNEPKVLSGWAKAKARGMKGIMLTATAEEYQLLSDAAKKDRRTLAGWVLKTALDNAK